MPALLIGETPADVVAIGAPLDRLDE